MSGCQICGVPTFGRLCARCQKMGKEGLVERVKEEAREKGYDLIYSYINRAWVIITQSPDDLKSIEFFGAYSTIEEAREWVNDEGD